MNLKTFALPSRTGPGAARTTKLNQEPIAPRSVLREFLKRTAPIILATLIAPAWAAAQNAPKALDLNFPNLAAQAKEKAEVDLDADALAGAAQMVKAQKGVADALSGVKGVHVRHYEFAAEGAYKDSDLDSLRSKVAADSSWSRIINVKEPKESTQIFLLKGENTLGGLLVINAEAKEVNVVEVLGNVDLSRLQEVVKSSISYDLKASAAHAEAEK